MQKFFYNNHYVPPLPEVEDCPYILLLKTTSNSQILQFAYDLNRPRYIVMFSEADTFVSVPSMGRYGAFVNIDNTKLKFCLYYTLQGGSNWVQVQLKEFTDMYFLLDNLELVWHNTKLYDADTDKTHPKKTGEQLVEGADPPVLGFFSSNLTILEGREIQPLYVFFGSPNENGTLKYTWHILVEDLDGGIVGDGPILYVPTTIPGVFQFYCLVDNIIGNDCTVTICPIMTVTIQAADAIPIEEKTEWLIGYLIGNMLKEKR